MSNSMCDVRNIPVEQIVRLKEHPSSKGIQDGRLPQSPKMFVYCSTPRPVLTGKAGEARPLYRNNVPKPEGWHSYYNISWDPRVRRGDPRREMWKREEKECEKIRRKLSQPRRTSAGSVKQQNIDRKITMADPDTMVRSANIRFTRLAISNLREKEKDVFTVDLADELEQDKDCMKGNKIGAPKALPKTPSSKKNLKDEASQILPNDFFDFDREVIPILERLVGSVCYQARLEVLEEEEYKALKLEREMFESQVKAEEEEAEKLKMQLERQTEERKRLLELAQSQTQEIRDGMYTFSLFGGVYVKIQDMSMSGDYEEMEAVRAATQEFLKTWINSEVGRQMDLHFESNKFLDGLIRRVVSEREADYAVGVWKPYILDEKVRPYSDELESSRAPPPTPGTSEYYTSDEEETQNLRSIMSSANYFPD